MPPTVDDFDENTGGWIEYRRLVLKELQRLDSNDQIIVEKLNDVDRQLVQINSRAALCGAVAGFVGGIIAAALLFFIGKIIGYF